MRPRASALLVVMIVSAVAPSLARAQFVTPVARPTPDRFVRFSTVMRHIKPTVDSIRVECSEEPSPEDCRLQAKDRIEGAWQQKCLELFTHSPREVQECHSFLSDSTVTDTDTLILGGALPKDTEWKMFEYVLRRGSASMSDIYSPFMRGRAGIIRLYRRASDLEVLTKFATGVRDDQIFVISDIISGAVGVLPFGISAAAIVTKDDSLEVQVGPDSEPVAIEGLTSDLTRLINNGGSVAARAGLPILASEGPNVRVSTSLYAQVGLLGPMGIPDSLAASGTGVVELMSAFAIREPSTAAHAGDLLVGLRGGLAWKESDLAPGLLQQNSFWFLQIGIGLTEEDGDFTLSVLYSLPLSAAVRDHVPGLVVNLAAER